MFSTPKSKIRNILLKFTSTKIIHILTPKFRLKNIPILKNTGINIQFLLFDKKTQLTIPITKKFTHVQLTATFNTFQNIITI